MATYDKIAGFEVHETSGLEERHTFPDRSLRSIGIYGCSRVGVRNSGIDLLPLPTLNYSMKSVHYSIGSRTYELSNQLPSELPSAVGNVLSVISDTAKGSHAVNVIPQFTSSTVISEMRADIRVAQDYSPFGVELDGRTFNSSLSRFGFNGKEKDDEIKGSGNSYDFGARFHDPRLGRWLSVDKRFKEYTCFSPYNFGLNNLIYYIDRDGNVIWDPVNKQEVVVTYDSKGKPTFLLSNGKPVSHQFIRNSVGVLNSLAKSEQGKQVIVEMMNVPTKVIIKEDAREVPNGTINERASGIVPKTNNKGEAEYTNDGFFEEVTITPNTSFIKKSARKNKIDYDELLLGVMTVEIGHFSTTHQIEKEKQMQEAGSGKILNESEIPNLQQKTKANYEPLFNQAAMRQYLYRIEKNQEINESVSVIGRGANSKSVNRAFETVTLLSTKQMETIVKVSEAVSKIKF